MNDLNPHDAGMSAANPKRTGCDFWLPCCCSRAADGHCWRCGCPKEIHRDGEHLYETPQQTPGRGTEEP